MRKRLLAIALTLCMTLAMLPQTALAADTFDASGVSVENFAELEAALQNADVSTITVTAPIAFTKTLSISRSVTFKAAEETVFSLGAGFSGRHFQISSDAANVDVDFGPIVLDGGGTAGGLSVNVSKPVSLRGGVIQNCKASNGGAINAIGGYSGAPVLTLAMKRISGNSASNEGGAVYIEGSRPDNMKLVVADGEITGNRASSSGGAVCAVMVKEVTMTGGTVDSNETSYKGGAFSTTGGTFRITGGTISNNICAQRGGALYMGGGPAPSVINIDGGTFKQNQGISNGVIAYGGAICMNNKTSFTMTAGTFSGNEAQRGGALCQETGSGNPKSFQITGGTFSGNKATKGSGGAIKMNATTAAEASFTDVIFTGNQAQGAADSSGGAVFGTGIKVFTNCTFLNNSADVKGGAIDGVSQPLTLSGCTFQGNSASNGGAVHADTSATAKLIIKGGKFSQNTATGEKVNGYGGAVSASPLKFIETDGVTFENNKGSHAYPGLPSGDIESAHNTHINGTAYTAPFTHAFNNYDIGPSLSDKGDDIAAMGDKHFRLELKAGDNGSLAKPNEVPAFVAIGTMLDKKMLDKTVPTADPGYTFEKWTLSDGGGDELPPAVTKDIALTAEFVQIKSHTLSFETNEGSPVEPIISDEGSKITLDQKTERAGYDFTGWYADSALTQKLTVITLTADKTVYAGWRSSGGSGHSSGGGSGTSHYTITFETNGGSPVEKITQAAGSKITLNQKTTRGGYTFTGWYEDEKLNKRITAVTLNKNITLYAGWDSGLLNRDPKPGYMKGYENGMFMPDANMTRAETSAMFYGLLLDQKDEGGAAFLDVGHNDWFATPVLTLASKGVLKGSNGYFRPNDSITRAEFAAIASRLLPDQGTGTGQAFSDVGSDCWAAKDIERISALGIIKGYPDGTFRPDANITRAEAVVVVNGLLGRVPNKAAIDGDTSAARIFPDVPKTHWAFYEIWAAANGVKQ